VSLSLNEPPDDQGEGLDWRCPYCGITVQLKIVRGFDSESSLDATYYLICRCPRKACQKVVFAKYDKNNGHLAEVYPFPSVSETSWQDCIPRQVRVDMAEATRCYYAQAYRGVVVMCRRALQNVAKNKGAEKTELKEQIKELHDSGLITKSLFDASHEIRHFGGFGAHPQDDGLDNIIKLDADTVFEFVSQILTHVYIMPAKTKELAKKRQEAKQGKKNDQP